MTPIFPPSRLFLRIAQPLVPPVMLTRACYNTFAVSTLSELQYYVNALGQEKIGSWMAGTLSSRCTLVYHVPHGLFAILDEGVRMPRVLSFSLDGSRVDSVYNHELALYANPELSFEQMLHKVLGGRVCPSRRNFDSIVRLRDYLNGLSLLPSPDRPLIRGVVWIKEMPQRYGSYLYRGIPHFLIELVDYPPDHFTLIRAEGKNLSPIALNHYETSSLPIVRATETEQIPLSLFPVLETEENFSAKKLVALEQWAAFVAKQPVGTEVGGFYDGAQAVLRCSDYGSCLLVRRASHVQVIWFHPDGKVRAPSCFDLLFSQLVRGRLCYQSKSMRTLTDLLAYLKQHDPCEGEQLFVHGTLLSSGRYIVYTYQGEIYLLLDQPHPSEQWEFLMLRCERDQSTVPMHPTEYTTHMPPQLSFKEVAASLLLPQLPLVEVTTEPEVTLATFINRVGLKQLEMREGKELLRNGWQTVVYRTRYGYFILAEYERGVELIHMREDGTCISLDPTSSRGIALASYYPQAMSTSSLIQQLLGGRSCTSRTITQHQLALLVGSERQRSGDGPIQRGRCLSQTLFWDYALYRHQGNLYLFIAFSDERCILRRYDKEGSSCVIPLATLSTVSLPQERLHSRSPTFQVTWV